MFLKSVLFTNLLCILVLFQISKCQSQTEYISRDGKKYDFSTLQKDPYWEVKELSTDSGLFAIAYVFNFGKNQPKCQDVEGAYEALDVLGQLTDSCDLIGKYQDQNVIEMAKNQGLLVQFKNGENCLASENPKDIGQPKQITFKIFCNKKDDTKWKISPVNSDTVTSCNVELTINHTAGCYEGQIDYFSFARIFKTLLWIIFFVIAFIFLGYLYNTKIKGMEGIEAIPYHQYIIQIPSVTSKQTKQVSLYLKNSLRKIQTKFNGHQEFQQL